MKDLQTRREFLKQVSFIGTNVLLVPSSTFVDVGSAELAAKRSRVIAACTKHWPENKGDCSAFVRAVGQDLGFPLTGNANAIYEQVAKEPWIRIGVGAKASTQAGIVAGEGKFVIAAEKGQGIGHVVVDYRNAFDSYSEVDRNKAVAFWGKLNSVGKEYARITLSWTAADLERVLFAYGRSRKRCRDCNSSIAALSCEKSKVFYRTLSR